MDNPREARNDLTKRLTESLFESLRDLAKSCAGPHGTIKVLSLNHDSAGGFACVAMTSNCNRLLEHNEPMCTMMKANRSEKSTDAVSLAMRSIGIAR